MPRRDPFAGRLLIFVFVVLEVATALFILPRPAPADDRLDAVRTRLETDQEALEYMKEQLEFSKQDAKLEQEKSETIASKRQQLDRLLKKITKKLQNEPERQGNGRSDAMLEVVNGNLQIAIVEEPAAKKMVDSKKAIEDFEVAKIASCNAEIEVDLAEINSLEHPGEKADAKLKAAKLNHEECLLKAASALLNSARAAKSAADAELVVAQTKQSVVLVTASVGSTITVRWVPSRDDRVTAMWSPRRAPWKRKESGLGYTTVSGHEGRLSK